MATVHTTWVKFYRDHPTGVFETYWAMSQGVRCMVWVQSDGLWQASCNGRGLGNYSSRDEAMDECVRQAAGGLD